MDQPTIALLLVAAGILLVVGGVLVWVGAFGWFGRLPGDITYQGERTTVHVPLGSMVVLSVVLTLLLNLVRRLFG